MIKYSKAFLNEVRSSAIQLSPEKPKIQLSGVFDGFWVSLIDSEIYTSDKRRFREDDGIDLDGEYFLIVENLLGSKHKP